MGKFLFLVKGVAPSFFRLGKVPAALVGGIGFSDVVLLFLGPIELRGTADVVCFSAVVLLFLGPIGL